MHNNLGLNSYCPSVRACSVSQTVKLSLWDVFKAVERTSGMVGTEVFESARLDI